MEICAKELNFYGDILIKNLSKTVTLFTDSVINDLLSQIPYKHSLTVQKMAKPYDYICLPQNKENCFNTFCPLVVNPRHSIALSAHRLMIKFIPFLMQDVIQTTEVLDREEEENLLSPPKTILSLLEQMDGIIDTMLSEYLIGDCICVVEADTDSFTYTLGYLLLWTQILEIFGQLSDEMKPQLTAFLRQSSYLSRLLENLFRLMPLSATDVNAIDGQWLSTTTINEWTESLVDQRLESTHIQRLSTHLYYLILRRLPASVRQWWNNCDRKTADAVNKYTASYFSGVLCAQELEAVQRADITQFKNMAVKARPQAREVVANYTIEEITIELLIQLPANHPLGPVGIDSGRRVGVSGTQWRTWLLQLTTFLTHQNGSILDGLILWKKNIDKRFEGVDECMICFYVLHGQTCQLPRLQCKYCKKRYHSACLYRWFNTSNNSTCPNCRNLF
ncbi:unnamed protein product [Oppiella nova]|uniref:E3 ubiquitin-protein ligase listerin n=1 Tax=Oppiella nova TaxID=334625 RepID=A0A7R9MDP7_9ACAR|nr:unnamed protein product [Oppiella nova]CAG2175323.1 unnamed protein product [Oppiella nova]